MPTSQRSVADICSNIDWNKAKEFIELGAGDGVFSRFLIGNSKPNSTITCVESNHFLAQQLKQTLSALRVKIVERDAIPFMKLLTHYGSIKADCIICGIPLSFMKKSVQLKFIKSCKDCLSSNGTLIFYQSIFTIYNLKNILKITGVKYKNSNLKIHLGNFPPLWSVSLPNEKPNTLVKSKSLAS